MSGIKDGGPAFPCPPTEYKPQGDILVPLNDPGMSLRDYFAAQIVSIIHAPGGMYSAEGLQRVAFQSYAVADAMLAERAKTTGES